MKRLLTTILVLMCMVMLFADAQTSEAGTDSNDPYRPEEAEGILLYELYGCDREALRDAVITCMMTDCEEGPREAAISSEEQETVRRLAINGKMAEKANDMCVTGGTTVYIFSAPDGTYLMSLEFFQGLLVRNDGMYHYTDE